MKAIQELPLGGAVPGPRPEPRGTYAGSEGFIGFGVLGF